MSSTSQRQGAHTTSRLAAALVIAGGFALGVQPARAQISSATLKPAPPSAIGDEMVQWMAVSPAYAKTGLVVAQTAALQCSNSRTCVHLWTSEDGGASWHRAKAQNWDAARFTIFSDAAGHDTLFGSGAGGLQRSDDDGQTWVNIGPQGWPSRLPGYSKSGDLAVASDGANGDYLLEHGQSTPVAGSGGAGADFSFAISPDFPAAGPYAPALLVTLDRKSQTPEVMRCTAKFSCSSPTPLPWPADANAMMSVGTVLLPAGDYAQTGAVFASTPFGISKSLDGGASFSPLNVAPTGAATSTIPMMALAPGYQENGAVRSAYAAVFQAFMSKGNSHTAGGVYRTSDGGTTWTPIASGGPFTGGAQAVAVASDGRLFAGYYDNDGHAGLLCSTDQGRSWVVSCPKVGQRDSAQKVSGQGASGAAQGAAGSSGPGGSANVSGSSGQGNSLFGGGTPNGLLPAATHQDAGSSTSWWRWVTAAVAGVLAVLALVVRFAPQATAWRRRRSN